MVIKQKYISIAGFISFVLFAVSMSVSAQSKTIFENSKSFNVAKAHKIGRSLFSLWDSDKAFVATGENVEFLKFCDSTCASCDTKTGICSKCVSGLILENNTCNTCPSNATCDGSDEFECQSAFLLKENACETCVENAICDGTDEFECMDGFLLSETGNSCDLPPTCGAAVQQENTQVAVASDAQSLSEALSSSKSIILVEENIYYSSNISLGTKKIVGPQYFSSIDICASEPKTTLTLTTTGNTMTVEGGEINNVNISFNSASGTALSISGVIEEATISADSATTSTIIVKETGGLTLRENVKIASSTQASALLNVSSTSLDISGDLSLTGSASYGVTMGSSTKITVASTGSLTLDMDYVWVGIDTENYSSFIANGPVKFEQAASSAFGYITVYNSVITLNANDNYIKASYSGLRTTSGEININGSTTIEHVKSTTDSSSFTAISSQEVYSSSVNSVKINAPVTLVGVASTTDSILYVVGGSIAINDTIESKTGVGKVFINADADNLATFGSSGAILGASSYTGYGKTVSVSSGAKLEINNVCRKASSSGTFTAEYSTSISLPLSPFTGGC